jgi:hypothetical protein
MLDHTTVEKFLHTDNGGDGLLAPPAKSAHAVTWTCAATAHYWLSYTPWRLRTEAMRMEATELTGVSLRT